MRGHLKGWLPQHPVLFSLQVHSDSPMTRAPVWPSKLHPEVRHGMDQVLPKSTSLSRLRLENESELALSHVLMGSLPPTTGDLTQGTAVSQYSMPAPHYLPLSLLLKPGSRVA